MNERLALRIDDELMERLLLLLVTVALIHIFFFSNTSIQYLYMFATFGVLSCISVYSRLINDSFFLLIVMFNLISVFITMMFYGGEGAAITFMNVLLSCLVFNNFKVRRKMLRKVHLLIALGLTAFLVTLDLTHLAAGYCMTLFRDVINANTFAILSLAACYNWIRYISLVEHKGILTYLLEIVFVGIFVYYIYLSNSRTTLGALVVFFFLLLFTKKSFSTRAVRFTTTIVLLLSLAMIPIYIYMANSSVEVLVLGKELFSGRQYVWQSAWRHFCQSPLIGKGTSVALESVNDTMTVSAHNTLLSIMYTLGLVPTVSFVIMITRRQADKVHYKYDRTAQMAFLSCLTLSFFESFFTDTHFSMFFLLFLLPIYDAHEERMLI